MQRINFGAKALGCAVEIGMDTDPVRHDRVQLGLRSLRRNIRAQARDHAITARVTCLHLKRRECGRFPNIDPLGKLAALHIEQRDGKLKARRHHSDDDVAAAV